MRAVCARRAARTAGLTGFLDFFPDLAAGFAEFLLGEAGFFAAGAEVFAVCAGFATGLCAGFFAADEAGAAGFGFTPESVCPITG